MSHCVYVIENLLDGKKYVGYTHNREGRWREHQRVSGRSQCHLHRAMRKHGVENFRFYVIEECVGESEGLLAEMRWIKQLNTFNDGYNMTKGGEGCHRSWTPEQRCAKSLAMKGRKLSAHTRQKLSEAGKGREVSDESRKKISRSKRGMKFSEEHRVRLREAAQRRWHPEQVTI